ncbi:MAG: hypothetical protein IIX17_04965 [Tidjanibacter sp.]|nr:hypothetical protein [Tidjanibacter sp.]
MQYQVVKKSAIGDFFWTDRADRADRNYGNYGNVAIKREQRLLADFAEREQRKDCEAGLIMGERGKLKGKKWEFKECREF